MKGSRDGEGLLAALRAEGLLEQAPPGLPSLAGLAADSRSVEPGFLFIAIRGSAADGHGYAQQAVAGGAAALVVERPLGLGVPEVVVRDGRRAAIALARAWHGDPGGALDLIGVTGTSGKTTTTVVARHLHNADGRAGSIGTLGAFDGRGVAVQSTAGSLTTPGPIDLQATLAGLRDRGVF
jgi:UDP-N-acetylmuramoyl-L-alanyl-D-glutamate--2,6-diaminopimelate ligase